MKKTFLIVLFICAGFALKAQTGYQEITDKRINYLATKLTLTPDEAQQFWPLFREYHTKREAATSNRKNLKNIPQGLSNDEYLKIVNDYIAVKTQQALLQDEYHKKYLKVLLPKKLLEFYKFDEEFNKRLLKQIKEAGRRRK